MRRTHAIRGGLSLGIAPRAGVARLLTRRACCGIEQLYYDRRHKPVPKGFNVIMVCDTATRLPLAFHVQDKREKLSATQAVELLMQTLPPEHYHLYTDRVRSVVAGRAGSRAGLIWSVCVCSFLAVLHKPRASPRPLA